MTVVHSCNMRNEQYILDGLRGVVLDDAISEPHGLESLEGEDESDNVIVVGPDGEAWAEDSRRVTLQKILPTSADFMWAKMIVSRRGGRWAKRRRPE